jgi:hypothetical protein
MKRFYTLLMVVMFAAALVFSSVAYVAAQAKSEGRSEELYEDYWGHGKDTYNHGMELQKQAAELAKRGKQMCEDGQKMMDKAEKMKKK